MGDRENYDEQGYCILWNKSIGEGAPISHPRKHSKEETKNSKIRVRYKMQIESLTNENKEDEEVD